MILSTKTRRPATRHVRLNRRWFLLLRCAALAGPIGVLRLEKGDARRPSPCGRLAGFQLTFVVAPPGVCVGACRQRSVSTGSSVTAHVGSASARQSRSLQTGLLSVAHRIRRPVRRR